MELEKQGIDIGPIKLQIELHKEAYNILKNDYPEEEVEEIVIKSTNSWPDMVEVFGIKNNFYNRR